MPPVRRHRIGDQLPAVIHPGSDPAAIDLCRELAAETDVEAVVLFGSSATGGSETGRAGGDHQGPQTTLLLLAGRITNSAWCLTLNLPRHWLSRQTSSSAPRCDCASCHFPPFTETGVSPVHQTAQPSGKVATGWVTSVFAAVCPADLALRSNFGRSTSSGRGSHTPHRAILSASRARSPFPAPLILGLTSPLHSFSGFRFGRAWIQRLPVMYPTFGRLLTPGAWEGGWS